MSEKSIIYGSNANLTYNDVNVSSAGELKTNNPLSAFGDLRNAEMTPQIQTQFTYGVNDDIFDSTEIGTGTVGTENYMLKLSTGVDAGGTAIVQTRKSLKHRSGLGCIARFTAMFTTGVESSSQFIGISDLVNGFFIGYDNENFSIVRLNNDVSTVVNQTSFSDDVLDGTGNSGMTLDPTKLNVFAIEYAWLGAGEIKFMIMNPLDGAFFVFHKISYANQYIVPSVAHPDMPLSAYVQNGTNTTDIIMYSASMSAFIEGKDIRADINNVVANTKATAGTTETVLFNINNVANLSELSGGSDIINHTRCYINNISLANDNNSLCTFNIYRDCTITSPTWVDVNGLNSVIQKDVLGTVSSFATGKLIYSCVVGKDSGETKNLRDLILFLIPGETYTVSVVLNKAGTEDAQCNIIINEDW